MFTQDVDGADLGADVAGHGLDGARIGQVGVHRDPGAARALEGGEEGVGVGVLAEVVGRDGRSGGGERPPDLSTDARGPAGDEGVATLLNLRTPVLLVCAADSSQAGIRHSACLRHRS